MREIDMSKRLRRYDDPALRDQFCQDLAKAAARQLRRVAIKDRDKLLLLLQDSTSLYAPYTADLTDKELGK